MKNLINWIEKSVLIKIQPLSFVKKVLQLSMGLLAVFFPVLAWGDVSAQPINFSPPPSDLSVVFLTDIFGVVDGVLYGGGSQIMGNMFSLFNSSILALGGMVLIYTTIVATINTAGEGQVLGKSWNSIWIPVRTTIGVSLLFTYPSGYSVLQIFVMWVVVQGVGAGDLIWDAALGYLQRGGVIVQPIPNVDQEESTILASANILNGASTMLTGIACMTALQEQISTMYSAYSTEGGACSDLPDTGGTTDQQNMKLLCDNGAVTLVNSSDVMAAQAAAMAGCTTCTAPSGTAGSQQVTTPSGATTSAAQALQSAADAYQQKQDETLAQLDNLVSSTQEQLEQKFEASQNAKEGSAPTSKAEYQAEVKAWAQEHEIALIYQYNKYHYKSCHSVCTDDVAGVCWQTGESCTEEGTGPAQSALATIQSGETPVRSDLDAMKQNVQTMANTMRSNAQTIRANANNTIATNESSLHGTAGVQENCLVQCTTTSSSGAATACTQGESGCTCQSCDREAGGCQVNSTCTNNPGSVTCTSNVTSSSSGGLPTCNTVVTLPMPNLPSTSPYYALNGICGTLTWNLMTSINGETVAGAAQDLNVSQQGEAVMENSRAIAVQQMFVDLSLVAQSMVQNDLTIYSSGSANCNTQNGSLCYFTSAYYSVTSPFGVPATSSGTVSPTCTGIYTPDACTDWISPSTGFSELLNGTELMGAVDDYNTIMEPTLNALENTATIAGATSFVEDAEAQGWIMAGSYFYNLVQVNEMTTQGGNAQSSSGSVLVDPDPGIESSTGPKSLSSFCSAGSSTSGVLLCTWYGAGNSSNATLINNYNSQISTLIQGSTPDNTSLKASPPAYPTPTATSTPSTPWPDMYFTELNTTVYGYEGNASNMLMPGQPGSANTWNILPPTAPPFTSPSVPTVNCPAINGYYDIPGNICELLGENVILNIINWAIQAMATALQTLLMAMLYVPLTAFEGLFNQAIENMNTYTANPIVGLAVSGSMFINTCTSTWLTISITVAALGMVPMVAPVVLIVVVILGPLIMTWLGMVFTMGVAMAYYIPLLPYVLFTFGAFGWLIGVVEAMVAAPIVALGVMLPEGHDVFGQGKDSLMLIFGAFLRPAMMIIGYIAAIILATVGIWMINTGFQYFQASYLTTAQITAAGGFVSEFANFFLFAVYIMMCIGIIERSFDMIYKLPDGVLKWIGGGMQSAMGSDTVGNIASKTEGKADESGKAMSAGASQGRKFGEGKSTAKSTKPTGGSVGGSGESGGGEDFEMNGPDSGQHE